MWKQKQLNSLSHEWYQSIILENIKIYSQNVCKNNFIINTILKTQSSFNIIFIQELSWSTIHSILSPTSCECEELVEVPNHPNWTMFSRNPSQASDSPRVITYINICISSLHFSLQNNILKYLKDTEVNINNVLIMTGNFNIKDCFWDPNFPHYSSHKNTLFDIADSFWLEISKLIEFFSTRYSDNVQNSNSVLDLVFLHPDSPEHDNHHIHPDWRLTSDHGPITINISIIGKHIQMRKHSLIKNSKEDHFFNELISFIKDLKTNSIQSINHLEDIVLLLANSVNRI